MRRLVVGTVGMLLTASLSACGGDGTLVVQVRSDLAPGADLGSVEVVVTTPDGTVEQRFDVDAEADDDWGGGVRVAEATLAAGTHRAVVTARDTLGEITVERPLIFEMRSGELRVITVLLTRDCVDVMCPRSGDDGSNTACLTGRCVEEGCSEETPERCGDRECDSAADCGMAAGACASRECTASGACVDVVDHSACTSPEVCSAAIGCAPPGSLSLPSAGHAHLVGIGTSPHAFRVELRPGAGVEDVTAALHSVFAPSGEVYDSAAGLSRDGEWMTLVTARGGFSDALLVARVRDLRSAELLDGYEAFPYSNSTITDDGAHVVFVDRSNDLRVLDRGAGGWTLAPTPLDADSPYAHAAEPSLRDDDATVLFVCGDDGDWVPTGGGICEVGIDGSGFRVLATPGLAGPGAQVDVPRGMLDGSVVFQVQAIPSGPLEVLRLPVGGGPAERFPSADDLESPCVLPDGRVVAIVWGDVVVLQPDGSLDLALGIDFPIEHQPFFVDSCGL